MSSAPVMATVTQTRERWCVMGSSSGHVSVFVSVLELAMTDGECLVASSFMSHPAIPHRAVFADFVAVIHFTYKKISVKDIVEQLLFNK